MTILAVVGGGCSASIAYLITSDVSQKLHMLLCYLSGVCLDANYVPFYLRDPCLSCLLLDPHVYVLCSSHRTTRHISGCFKLS